MSITRGNMRSRIQRRIGDTAATTFYSTALYNDIIDARCQSWVEEIKRLTPNYYLAHQNYTGVDDAIDTLYEFYNWPADFGTFVKLERQFGTGQAVVYQEMRKVNPEDQDRYRIGFNLVLLLPDSMQNFQQTVADWGSKFRLIPPPQNNGYLYRLRYLQKYVAATADETVLNIPDEWQELITLDCASFVLQTSGDPISQDYAGRVEKEYALMKRTFRRHSMSIEGIGTMDRMT